MKKEMTPARARRMATVRLMQKVQHAVPGFVLLGEGVTALTHGVAGWNLALSIAEIATCGAVFVALVIALRELRVHQKAGTAPHIHVGIDWIDIFLGLMLFTEVAASYPEHHKLWRPATLLGIVMIILGLFGGKFIAWKQRARG